MEKGIYIIAAISVALTLSSCGEEVVTENEDEVEETICFYTYEDQSTTFEWTGYKTTSKIGVKGTFNEMTISGDESSDDPIALLESLTFSMTTASVETGDEGRNKKIAETFFGSMASPETITGKVKELNDQGMAIISVTMNGATADVEGEYTLVDGAFEFTSTVDVSMWTALASLEALHELCVDLHTGDDGVPKTWTEVGLSFSTRLTSDCD